MRASEGTMENRIDRIAVSLARLLVAGTVAVALIPHAQAQTSSVTVNVVSATDGAPIGQFRYLINVDNTGSTAQRSPADGCNPASPGYPGSCLWTSIAGVPGSSPVYTQGDQADFPLPLPAGRYLVSVLADGHKIDGEHFTVPLPAAAGGVVTVRMQPYALPAATIQAAVFEDVSPVNGAPDLPAEHGLAGFQGKVADSLGDVSTDVFGNPLCTEYARDAAGNVQFDADGAPVVSVVGGVCLSKCYVVVNGTDVGTVQPLDAAGRCPTTTATGQVVEGKLEIPNLGPNRYALTITPPNGSGWVQTTTLEGNLDWDSWVMEGATGLDTEFVVAGEPFPAVIFGFVPGPSVNRLPAGGTGSISGVVEAVKIYIPAKGGVAGLPGTIWGGLAGAKIDAPVPNPWVTLTDLTNGDTVVWVGRGDANGRFQIAGVPAGSYTLTWWDAKLNYILDLVSVTVGDGEAVDMGILPLTGWWTRFEGYVFDDLNLNGVRDPGEPGIPNFTLTVRRRDNSLMDRGATAVSTDQSGYYLMENTYPMTQWLVMEAYSDLHYGTGVTFQADNQPAPTTHLGAGVDISVLPIIGLSGRVDWGKRPYDPTGASGPSNGGIVGTVSYDTTRNELDPAYAAAEDWQPGIPGLVVKLYAPVGCGTNAGAPCDPTGRYEFAADGSYARGTFLNTYVTEAWQRPTGCVARDVDGNPLVHGVDENVLPTDPDAECLEGPLMGVQVATYSDGQGNFGANVDGNYGFGDGCFNGVLDATDPSAPVCVGGTFEALPGARDYLVEVEIPNDALGRPLYKVTREDDINIGNGDDFVPAVPPPACAGPLHIVDVAGSGTDAYPSFVGDGLNGAPTGVTVPASTPTFNPTFADIGGSPFEGQARPLCNVKLVPLANGKSIVPIFHLFTDVPLPGRFWGLLVDDLTFSADPRSLLYGEKAGIPFAPVGIYDYTNRLVHTAESDFNGLFDVLLPSTNRINCPTPSGVCANLYRFVGNDPGVAGKLNLNYNPRFRTIAAEFEAIPGVLIPADLAPTQVGVTVQLPGGQVNAVNCTPETTRPQIHRVDRPYGSFGDTLTITGVGFGATRGQVRFDDVAIPGGWIIGWTDTQIQVLLAGYGGGATASRAAGPHQLSITKAGTGPVSDRTTVNGLTFHYLRSTGSANVRYDPAIFEVGPGRTYAPAETLPLAADHAIQRALDAAATFVAASSANASRGALVVVYPNVPSVDPRQNPRGAYYENLIVTRAVKLQGVGPGSPDGAIRGSIIDGGASGGDSPVVTDWYARMGTLTWAGNQAVSDGAVISIYATATAFPTTYSSKTAPSIDGFDLRGGNQGGFPGNIDVIGGGPTGLPANMVTQGGAIFANGFARNLQITNNLVQNNGGAYGTIRIGTPDLPASDNQNDGVRIANNRIILNGGTNLAGGVGIFAGANGFEIARNDICGNFSAEYGGGLSVYGYSPNGRIHHNRIYFNQSYDEGGGVMIAGQLPADPATLSPGSGPIDVHSNLIQANLANDDGGGLRFLMAGNFPMNVHDNFIVNNVSTHEGGGVSLNDAPDVRFFNNTVMKNLTTATAVTSTGIPAPAGLSTSLNSDLLQATLPPGSAAFSDPLLFNNVFWDNRAGSRAPDPASPVLVIGIGLAGDPNPINHWDVGAADGSGLLSPTSSILQATTGIVGSPTNVLADPVVSSPYDVSVAFAPWRTNPAFIGAILVAVDLPPSLMGDYHLTAGSPAIDLGAASKGGVAAPTLDIDDGSRTAPVDAGADEFSSP
ncbi:MAG: pectin lyase-like protein [Anaeromyxobacteraceae bacterium]|nr:pectin lyase-like protein [Anaeromyxobacteraceae bacterium]